MKVHLQNETTGIQRTVKVGFSWVILFFGFIPFMLRGMLAHSVIIFTLDVVVPLTYCIITKSIEGGTSGIAAIFVHILLAFLGNKMTATHYLERGYKRTGDGWDYANAKWGFVVK